MDQPQHFTTSKLTPLGIASCFGVAGLVALAFICPTTAQASAKEAAAVADDVAALSIAIDQPMVEVEVDPSKNGGYAEGSTTIQIATSSSAGYKISMQTEDGTANLNRSDTITDHVGPVNGIVTASGFGANTWGYNLVQGTNPGQLFQAVPSSSSNVAETATSANNDTWTLTFAAKVASTLPAGSYHSKLIISAVANPVILTGLDRIDTMQAMTTEVCSQAEVGDSKQLTDVRDGQSYWVTKLADENCWMTQNLALDFKDDQGSLDSSAEIPTTYAATVLTSETSDLGWSTSNGNDGSGGAYPATVKTWSGARVTQSVVPRTTQSVPTETRSWNLGAYYELIHDGSIDCGDARSISVCINMGVLGASPAATDVEELGAEGAKHYLIGNYYQWNTATAGTGDAITSGEAADSICPRNWKLPTSGTSNNTEPGSFYYLLNKYGLTTQVTNDNYDIASVPLFFVRSGFVAANGRYLYKTGKYGRYWSSTPDADAKNAYRLILGNIAVYASNNSYARYYGFSLRCLAR